MVGPRGSWNDLCAYIEIYGSETACSSNDSPDALAELPARVLGQDGGSLFLLARACNVIDLASLSIWGKVCTSLKAVGSSACSQPERLENTIRGVAVTLLPFESAARRGQSQEESEVPGSPA